MKKVEVYGSCATKLFLPSSDVDLVVCIHDAKDSPKELLTALANFLVSFLKSLWKSSTF